MAFVSGPKKKVNDEDMKKIDYSQKEKEMDIEAKKREFMETDDDLHDRGFIDEDVKIDFSKFKVGKASQKEKEEEE